MTAARGEYQACMGSMLWGSTNSTGGGRSRQRCRPWNRATTHCHFLSTFRNTASPGRGMATVGGVAVRWGEGIHHMLSLAADEMPPHWGRVPSMYGGVPSMHGAATALTSSASSLVGTTDQFSPAKRLRLFTASCSASGGGEHMGTGVTSLLAMLSFRPRF